MKTFVKKAGVLFIAAVIAGKIILFPAQALAKDYNPNTFELNIAQTELYKPEQTSLEEITEQLSGWTYADRALIASMYYGVDYAREQTEKGIITNPFGEKFDYILASNPSGNLPINLLRAVFTNIGNSPMDIKDNYENIKKLSVNELWCHSQGCDTFINWANTGEIKAKILRLTGAPMTRGFGYMDKLRKAAAIAGVEEIYIYQNLGDKENRLDDDHVTAIKFPSLQQVKDPKSFKVGMVWEIGNENLEAKVKINLVKLYTSHGEGKTYIEDSVKISEVYNMPASGHGMDRYYENIKAIQ